MKTKLSVNKKRQYLYILVPIVLFLSGCVGTTYTIGGNDTNTQAPYNITKISNQTDIFQITQTVNTFSGGWLANLIIIGVVVIFFLGMGGTAKAIGISAVLGFIASWFLLIIGMGSQSTILLMISLALLAIVMLFVKDVSQLD
jgi:hypothetical protein